MTGGTTRWEYSFQLSPDGNFIASGTVCGFRGQVHIDTDQFGPGAKLDYVRVPGCIPSRRAQTASMMTQDNMTSLAPPRSLKEFRPVAAAAPNPPTLRRKASVIVSVDAEDADAKPAEQHPCKRRAVMKVKTSRFERVLDDDE